MRKIMVLAFILGGFYILPREANADFIDSLKDAAKGAIDNVGKKDEKSAEEE